MKTISKLLLVVCATVSLTSCLTSEYNSTPMIYTNGKYIFRTTAAGVNDTILYGDTVQVADTLRAPLVLWGGYNNLVSFQATLDTSVFDYHLEYDTTCIPYLDEDSKPESGYLHFTNNCCQMPVTLWYVPKKSGDYTIHFTISSTAAEKFSPNTGYFQQPVR